MKRLTKNLALFLTLLASVSCSKDKDPVANNVTLHFDNTFKNTTIVLGDATAADATVNTSANGQDHHFSELKYVISNIRLVKENGSEIPYHINDLDNGATVVNHAKPQTLNYVLSNIPAGEYSQIKFGLGVRPDLNTLDEFKFPNFYAAAGANDTDMMWQWAVGYRFTKIEGFYEPDNKEMSIHTGSTVDGNADDPTSWVQGVDAYRDITLTLPDQAVVGSNAPKITIKADFHKLLSGETEITLASGNATTPGFHSSMEDMERFVDNLAGMFSVSSVEN